MSDTVAAAKTRIREAVAVLADKGLDAVVAEVEAALVQAWSLERRGVFGPREVPGFIDAVLSHLKKLAPPPPKKVKFSDPLRKILPLAETSVRPAADCALLILALSQVGDFTETTDKKRKDLELFLDDWRRMIFESARIQDWARFRQVAGVEERHLEGRLSRESAWAVLQAIQARRSDNITPVPDVSMLCCGRCGGFRGRDRIRCATCKGTFCTRCLGPTADTCIGDYAVRYASIDPETRQRISAEVRALLKEFRLDAYSRNDTFIRALKERGVDVVFTDASSLEGDEANGQHGRVRFSIREREGPAIRRAFFSALARNAFRSAGEEPDPLRSDYFVELCLGLPIDEALKAASVAQPAPQA
jgi:hypothetical protein